MKENGKKPSEIISERMRNNENLFQELENGPIKGIDTFLQFLDESQRTSEILTSSWKVLDEKDLEGDETMQTILINGQIFKRVIDGEGHTKSLELLELEKKNL